MSRWLAMPFGTSKGIAHQRAPTDKSAVSRSRQQPSTHRGVDGHYHGHGQRMCQQIGRGGVECVADLQQRSEEHTSELQSLMRISYAVFCLKKKKTRDNT